VIQPLLDFCEPQFTESDASEHRRARTPSTLRIFFAEFFLLVQSFSSFVEFGFTERASALQAQNGKCYPSLLYHLAHMC